MKTRRESSVRSMDELRQALELSRLLSPSQLQPFFSAEANDPGECLDQLVEQGLLTPFQARQVLAGRGRRLVLGPYRIEEQLGAGGMGRVYKASHRLLKRPVALKVIRVRRRGDASTRKQDMARLLARFRREVEAHARLNHPHIVTAFDAGIARGVLYLALEYVGGIDLGRLVASNGPLPLALACEVVRQAALALHHAHGQGWIHRDVKPANLLLAPTRPGQAGVTIKLLDLGLAQLTDGAGGDTPSGELKEEVLAGTPDFMAPEQGLDAGCLDPRSDLYSLGCTFYFLLSGQLPHPGGSPTEKLLRHRLDSPRSLRELRPEVPADLAAIVECLLARDPEERCPSAAALLTDLYQLATGTGTPALRQAPVRSRPATRRDPGAAWQPRPQTLRPPQPGRKRGLAALVLAAVVCGLLVAWGARRLGRTGPPRENLLVASEPTAARAEAFQVGGRSWASLAEAIAAAKDGDVITLAGNGPYRAGPLQCQDRALTLRAREGSRPCLELAVAGETLLHANRPLTLEGIDLRHAAGDEESGFLVCCEGTALHLRRCRLHAGARALAVLCRGCSEVTVESCVIEGGRVGVSAQVNGGSCRLRVEDSRIESASPSGAALSLWAGEMAAPAAAMVSLERSELRAGRAVALCRLREAVGIQARGCRFHFQEALLSCAGYGSPREGLRQVEWSGAGNRVEAAGDWLSLEGVPAGVRDEAGWKAVWQRR